ncbi:hypothetical protein B0H34DRAFT_738953 [Crassisporium funariophilum]|nr:hypothetical protein B0H34DRAFT_738953 [Crassisporium funariophilum]
MHFQEAMPDDLYYDYNHENQFQPDTPDTFFAQVQPLTSDSAHTPPSPITFAKPNRKSLIKRPSQSNSTPLRRGSTSTAHTHGPTGHIRRERERALANTPRDTLIQLVIHKEYEAKESKKLLHAALVQLDLEVKKLAHAETRARALEEEQQSQGVKITQAVIEAQKEAAVAKEEVGLFKLQLDNSHRDLERVKSVVRAIEVERDDADRALVRARTTARQLKEQAILIQAREEGRREGFEEGLRQGRIIHTDSAFIEASPRVRKASLDSHPAPKASSRKGHRSSSGGNPPAPAPVVVTQSSLEADASKSQMREIDERENLRMAMQLKDAERERDMAISKGKDLERDMRRMEKKFKDEMQRQEEKEADRLKELEREKERVREREETKLRDIEREREREKDRMAREREREQWELQKEKERLERAREEEIKMKEQLEREKREVERDRERDHQRHLEAERERQREKELERERRREERAAAAVATAAAVVPSPPSSIKQPPIPYLAMAPPPSMPTAIVMPSGPSNNGTSGVNYLNRQGVPRTGSSGSQRAPNRRTSVGSSSSVSTMPIDILQFPNERERDHDALSVIPEDSSARGTSPSMSITMPAVPSWVTNPPIDYTKQPYDGGAGINRGGDERQFGGPSNGQWQQQQQQQPRGQQNPYPHHRQNPDLLSPAVPPFGPRRTSSGSTGSYEINIEPPSRPPSSLGQQEVDGTGIYLSPNTAPIPLAPPTSETPILPVLPRRVRQNTPDISTQPNSPVILSGPLPEGFVPTNFRDMNGVSTPIHHNAGLPPMMMTGGPGGPPFNNTSMHQPVIPTPRGGPAPIYGNPVARERERQKERERDRSQHQSYGIAPPPFPFSPSGGSNRPVIPSPPSQSAGAWGTSIQHPGPGMTPVSSSRDLPGLGDGGVPGYPAPSTSASGISIYGPPASGVYQPQPPHPMPMSALYHGQEDEDDDGFDDTTTQNTHMNASLGRGGKPVGRRR